MVKRVNELKIVRKAFRYKGQRRRQETYLVIRKQKKDLKLKTIKEHDSVANDISRLADFKKALLSASPTEQEIIMEATRGIRQLCGNQMKLIQIVDAEIVPLLIRILDNSGEHGATIIYEALWALSNIAFTNYAKNVANWGAIKPLVDLLRHNDARVQEQSAWCLGNIAGQDQNLREQILNQSGLKSLLINLAHPKNMDHLRQVMFAIANLCKGNLASHVASKANLLGPLVLLLDKPIAEEIKADILWAISYLTDGDEKEVDFVISIGILSKLIKFLDQDCEFKQPIVCILGNFVSESDSRIQTVLDSGILNHLAGLLSDKLKGVRKGSSYLASRIVCGSHEQITQLVKRKINLHRLIMNATNDQWVVRKEALWALANICTNGNHSHILSLIRAGGFEPLIDTLALENVDVDLLMAALSAIEHIFDVHEQHLWLFAESQGIDHLEELQTHRSDDVYHKVVYLIEKYFGVEEDENLAPEKDGSDHYSFQHGVKEFPSPALFPTNPMVQSHRPEKGLSVFGSGATKPLF
mmetsp:Transcript_10555/g.30911  ORF Transcript_10555/g.30911 Transcript_10555/m.30911 type:complete len:527 (-) Transcript_10555:120-1700(-)